MDPEGDELPFPFEYMCPITHNLMEDPVITVDGHTFDREVIETWFNKGHKTNPLTNKELSSTQLIPNRCLKSLISCFKEKASGFVLNNINKYKYKSLGFNVNEELGKRFPTLVDSFGMVKIPKLQKIIKENNQLKQERKKLLEQIKKLSSEAEMQKNEIKYYFPQFYQEGKLNFNAISKTLKQDKILSQQNQELSKKLKILEQQLSVQQQQVNLVMSLMNASHSEGASLEITEPWYDEAAAALAEVVVPPKTLFIHITESKLSTKIEVKVG